MYLVTNADCTEMILRVLWILAKEYRWKLLLPLNVIVIAILYSLIYDNDIEMAAVKGNTLYVGDEKFCAPRSHI